MGKFTPNHPKVGGRVRGTPNKRTVMGREFAERLCNDPEYLANLERRAKTGRLPPAIEQMLWYFAHGKPKDMLEVSGSVNGRDVATMSTSELLSELEQHQHATALLLAEHHGQRHSS